MGAVETIRTAVAGALEGLLPLPERSAKPRAVGVTHVVDPGMTRVEAEGLMEIAAQHVAVVRLGWGSALVTGAPEAKLAVYREHDVAPMPGGTLTEPAYAHARVEALREALVALGIRHVEVSEGTLDMPVGEKRRLIRGLCEGFTVFVEGGRKDGGAAAAVVGAGRVRADAVFCWPVGSIRDERVGSLVAPCGVERLIFEAPRRSQ